MPLYLVTSIILVRNILPGFPFPLNRKRDVSNIRCQRVQKQRDIGLQLQLKCIKALWIQKIHLSVVLLIYKMHTPFIYFRLMWSTWCFVRVQYGWPALTSPRFPFGSRFFIQHTHTYPYQGSRGNFFRQSVFLVRLFFHVRDSPDWASRRSTSRRPAHRIINGCPFRFRTRWS